MNSLFYLKLLIAVSVPVTTLGNTFSLSKAHRSVAAESQLEPLKLLALQGLGARANDHTAAINTATNVYQLQALYAILSNGSATNSMIVETGMIRNKSDYSEYLWRHLRGSLSDQRATALTKKLISETESALGLSGSEIAEVKPLSPLTSQDTPGLDKYRDMLRRELPAETEKYHEVVALLRNTYQVRGFIALAVNQSWSRLDVEALLKVRTQQDYTRLLNRATLELTEQAQHIRKQRTTFIIDSFMGPQASSSAQVRENGSSTLKTKEDPKELGTYKAMLRQQFPADEQKYSNVIEGLSNTFQVKGFIALAYIKKWDPSLLKELVNIRNKDGYETLVWHANHNYEDQEPTEKTLKYVERVMNSVPMICGKVF